MLYLTYWHAPHGFRNRPIGQQHMTSLAICQSKVPMQTPFKQGSQADPLRTKFPCRTPSGMSWHGNTHFRPLQIGLGQPAHLLAQDGRGGALRLDGLEARGRLDLAVHDELPHLRALAFTCAHTLSLADSMTVWSMRIAAPASRPACTQCLGQVMQASSA